MIKYTDDIGMISEKNLGGFFVGWKKKISSLQHYEILKGSSFFIAAINKESGQVVGFVTALSDGVLSGFIPLLEVLPEYKGKGIGTMLIKEILIKLEEIANIDLTCDAELEAFYKRFNMHKSGGMILRGEPQSIRSDCEASANGDKSTE